MMIQSVMMLFSLVTSIGSYPADVFGEPQVAVTDCECVLITLLDGNSGKHIGNCLTTLNSEFWCYVTSTSPCSDKKESSRAPGLYYSFQGCKGNYWRNLSQPFLPPNKKNQAIHLKGFYHKIKMYDL
eukprot:TRINITY_DN2987_c0_g1_i4.p1 TRINITY_DN2987_c0_g1~~TRINITY_DN2987_c0_g1_i4.p1  ORF type:complete len:127 (-),score=17.83 TRINITY_DN2987_c0_g1_i4:195-575(-)